MTDLSVGDHCSLECCNRLDFLPITCDGCRQRYCKDHSDAKLHKCSGEFLPPSLEPVQGPKSFPCSLPGCSNATLVPIYCDSCERPVCISHKQKELHNCAYTPQPVNISQPNTIAFTTIDKEALKSVSQPTIKSSQRPVDKRSEKTRNMEAKLNLMKNKMTAQGPTSVPEKERAYFRLIPAGPGKPEGVACYFSCRAPLGRLLDYGAEKLKLKHTSVDDKKLGVCLPGGTEHFDLSFSIEEFFKSSALINGETLVLCYF